jgi:signal-transduction protein with cAMP-binding, CBS, and nucleotidyltransferase domain
MLKARRAAHPERKSHAMDITDSVRSVLARKGYHVSWVPALCPVRDALERMAAEDIGALAVMDGDRLLGVFTERDYARKIILLGRSSAETTVAEAMTHPATCVTSGTTVDDCMRLMVVNRSRHIFVMEDGKVAGVVSIGDLVNWIISVQADTITQLQGYIAGSYPG